MYLHTVLLPCVCACVCVLVVLISSYGAPSAQRASYFALHSSLFGSDGAANYDYIVTNSINSLFGLKMVHTLTHG